MKKTIAIRNHYTREKTVGSINNQPSMTVPDQALTIRDIINRTKKGLPVTGVKVPMYNETEHGIMPDLRNMDISEIAELKQRIKRTEEKIRQDLARQEQEQKQKEAEEYYRKKFKTDEPKVIEVKAEEVK